MSVEIDEKLWARAFHCRAPSTTNRALIEEALRVFVKLHDQAKTKQLRGKLTWTGDDLKDLRE